jgi:uncharacterized protein (TIGR02145 family)
MNYPSRIILMVLFLLHGTVRLFSQPGLPPTVQDCLGAIPVCQSVYSTTQSYLGHGNVYPEIRANNACPLCMDGEINDVFYIFTVQTSGVFRFTLTPNNPNNDYDWELFNMTNATCDQLYTLALKLSVSCNSYGLVSNSGPTGINTLLSDNTDCNGGGSMNGPPFNKDLDVLAGQTYLLNISNWSSTNQEGYTLDFSTSTAQIYDNVAPFIDSIQGTANCDGADSLYVRFSENVLCADLQNHPEKFALTSLSNTYTVTGVSSHDCQVGGTQTFYCYIKVFPPLMGGNYDLYIVGDIGDLCGNIAAYQDYPFHVDQSPGPVVELGPDVWICGGNTHLFDAGPGFGYTYRWDDLTTNSIGIATTQTYATGIQGLYKVTVTDTSGCSRSDSANLFINPKPNVTNDPMSAAICSGTTFTLNLTSATPGTTFSWVPAIISGTVTGATAGSGTILSNLLINTQSTNGVLQYTITPISGGCYGNDTIYTVVVKPIPQVTNSLLNFTVCSPGNVNIPLTSQVAASTFGWRATGSSGNVSGYSNGTGLAIQQVLTNTGSTPGTVTYKAAASANGCTGDSVLFTVTVNPSPVLTNSPLNQAQCNGMNTSILLTSNVAGTLFTWTATGSSLNVSGYSNNNIPGTQISQTLLNTGFAVETVTYHITPEANTCNGLVYSYIVTVFPTPDLQVTPAAQTICSGAATNLSLHSNVTGTTFAWTASGSSPDISGYANGAGNVIQQILFNAGYLVPSVTYHITPSANGCTGPQNTAVVSVNRGPTVAFPVCFDTVTTTSAKPISLKGGIPLGGTYSGPGVNSVTGVFTPSLAGVGNKTITYSYTNAALCSAAKTRTIVVQSPPAFTCGNNLTDIRDGKIYPTVQINSQCWMAEDLNYGYTIDESTNQRDNCVPEKYIRNSSSVIRNYYQWDEIMQYDNTPSVQGLCPPGWHIPTEAEWNTLFNVFISNGFAGSPLKYSGYSGFNALLSGARHQNVKWDFPDFATFYWTSNSHGTVRAVAHGMNEADPSVSLYPALRSNAFPVRCLRD